MDASCINRERQLAWFPNSVHYRGNVSGLSVGKVSVNALRDKLYLLAMLPAKDGSEDIKQARIPLGLFDAPADRKVAEKRCAALQRQVDTNTFNWDDWREATKGTSWRQAIDQL